MKHYAIYVVPLVTPEDGTVEAFPAVEERANEIAKELPEGAWLEEIISSEEIQRRGQPTHRLAKP